MIENQIIQDRKLTKETVLVYLALAFHCDADGQAFPSLSLLAEESRCSRRGVVNALARLARAGYLEKKVRKTPKGDFASNLYILTGRRGGGSARDALGGSAHGTLEQDNIKNTEESTSPENLPSDQPASPPTPSRPEKQPRTPHGRTQRVYRRLYEGRTGTVPPFNARLAGLLKGDLARLGEQRLTACLRWLFENPPSRMRDYAYGSLHLFLPNAEKGLLEQQNRRALIRVCPSCGLEQESTSAQCLYCGEPMKRVARAV